MKVRNSKAKGNRGHIDGKLIKHGMPAYEIIRLSIFSPITK